MSKSFTSTTTVRLILHIILVVNVCSHICNYCNHICDYNVDIIEWSCKCNYNLWLLHQLGWKSKMKIHIFHPILRMDPLDGWCCDLIIKFVTKGKAWKGAGRNCNLGITFNSWKCKRMWGNDPTHSQVDSHFGNWSLYEIPYIQKVISRVKIH
jgi:hypothetical protein